MYIIKEKPEDFIVKEITSLNIKSNGDYSIFSLKKRDYTTIKALETIADRLNIKLKRIGFAGTKDKKAITEQYISIFNINKDKVLNLKIKDLELTFIGNLDKPISLGDLKGNEFEILIKNANNDNIKNIKKKMKNINKMPNFFGEQRFSKNNKEIGKNIVKNNFKKAVEVIIKDDEEHKKKIKSFLEINKNNYVGALRLIPIKIVKLYIHSYQSYLWNLTVKEYLKNNNNKKEKFPLIGFGIEINDKRIKKIVDNILKKEKINPREFIIRKIPELSSEGVERDLFIKIKDFKRNIKKDIIKLSFFLEKGSYATTVIEYLLN